MKDAPVFVFDEPTASLDIETEAHILKEITNLSKSKLCILISHRMFANGIADPIIVLSKGRIVEEGSYDDLIACNGRFTKMQELYFNITGEKLSQSMDSLVTTIA